MTIYHVHFTCAPDYNARRLPFRPAHLAQLASLREQARVVAGGPEPDGTAANIFYRVADRAELSRLLAENEFQRAGLFIAHHVRAFIDFLEPVDRPPLDAGLKTTLVESSPRDHAAARATLIALRAGGQVAFGGFLEDGTALAIVRSASPDEAVTWLTDRGGWGPMTTRAWSQTL